MARNDGRERPYVLAITCSLDEKKKIQEKAKLAGLSMSAYARVVLLSIDKPVEKIVNE